MRPTRAEVDLSALRHNVRAIRKVTRAAVCAVVKADAYGHGAEAIARALEGAGVSALCVALLEEAVDLREAGVTLPILVMGGSYDDAWGEVLRHGVTPVLHGAAHVDALANEVRFRGCRPVGVHVKLDTGMGRLGVSPALVPEVARLLAARPEVTLTGLMTHFACADSTDTVSLDHQLQAFAAATREFRGSPAVVRHAANSAALFRSERAHLDAVRPGIALFGVAPCAGCVPELRPVMRLLTEIVALRTIEEGGAVGYGATWRARRASRIATIPLGYADGLSRSLSSAGQVLVRGRRAPIVGTISMDLTMVDVTDVPGAMLRDEVVTLGAQHGPLGSDEISAAEMATLRGTIPWEVFTNVSRRVPRVHIE